MTSSRPIKFAFYMTGNYAEILRHCTGPLSDFSLLAFCPNANAYAICSRHEGFDMVDYLYDGLNELVERRHPSEFMARFPSVNLSRVLFTDKSYYKRTPAAYQLRVICAMGLRMAEWFAAAKPTFLFFPIIESIDAMLAYELALAHGAKPIVYSHARHVDASFLSEDCNETLPSYLERAPKTLDDRIRAEALLNAFKANPTALSYATPGLASTDRFASMPIDNPIRRLVKTLQLRCGVERHNRTLLLSIKLQIYFAGIVLPLRRLIYRILEHLIIRPRQTLPPEFDYFPLHFSPESSINTPAPFYIDQMRVIDRILLERAGNRPLVLKEHPAMRGNRPLWFYREALKRPFVTFVPSDYPGMDLIQRAHTVYSVTGTACVEALLLGTPWRQFGINFLSAWLERKQSERQGREATPCVFIEDVLSVSGEFVLFAPGHSLRIDERMYSKANITALCTHIQRHLQELSSTTVLPSA